MQKVSVIILNYNGKDNTLDCLESLRNVLLPKETKLEIVVVDNSQPTEFRLDDSIRHSGNQLGMNLTEHPESPAKSDSGQARMTEFEMNFRLKIIKNNENLGFAEGNNVGIRYALKNDADYVLILNNDTIVDKNLIQELLNIAKTDSRIGIIGPKIYFAPGFEFHKNRYGEKDLGKVFWYAGGEADWQNVIGHHRGVDEVDKGQYDKVEETSFVSGCCVMIKKELLDKVGFFDEKYFLYYEDSDLCERAKKAGFKIIYAPKAIIWHKNAGSAGGSGSKLQDYYITRNRLLFGVKYASFRAKLALIKESVGILINGRYWQKRGVLDFYLNRFKKGSFKI